MAHVSPASRCPPISRRAEAALLVPTLALSAFALTACAGGGRHDSGYGATSRAAASTSTEWAGLRYTVSLVPTGSDRLRARATVENTTDRLRTAELPWCLVWLRVYRSDRLIWDQSDHDPCEGLVRAVQLVPGEAIVRWGSALASEILAGGHPDGSYTIRAYLPRPEGRELPRAEVELTLGTVELTRSEEDAR